MFNKAVCAGLMVCLLSVAGIAFLVSGAETEDASTFWSNIGQQAWSYFNPGAGIDPVSGLVRNCVGSNEFTDWDLALYVQAILDAEKIGILNSSGQWGSADRLDKVLLFLEKRPLMPDGLPYLSYHSNDGSSATQIRQVATDTGALLVVLKNVENSKPELKQRIDTIVYNSTNYERCRISIDAVRQQLENGVREPCIYDYYVTCGFALFWPERFADNQNIVLKITTSAPTINYSGVNLPSAKITMDPLLLSVFNLANQDPTLTDLCKQSYLAQEARYNNTGKYTAFSEGGTDSGVFVWEWIVTNEGNWWILQTGDSNDVDTTLLGLSPVTYFKAAIGLHAIYNTAYTRSMCEYLIQRVPCSNGYSAGVDENGKVIYGVDVSNGLIVSAARYAINNITVQPSYSPTPTTPSPSPSTTQTPNPPPQPTATPTPTQSSTQTPQPTATPNTNTSQNIKSELSPKQRDLPLVYAMFFAIVMTLLMVPVIVAKNKAHNSILK